MGTGYLNLTCFSRLKYSVRCKKKNAFSLPLPCSRQAKVLVQGHEENDADIVGS